MSYVRSGLGATDAVAMRVRAVAENYQAWKTGVMRAVALGIEPVTLANVVARTDATYNALIAGDVSRADILGRTMAAVSDLIREAATPVALQALPTIQSAYTTTTQAIRDLVQALASTAGSAAGTVLKSAADAAGVKPELVGGGVKTIIVAAAVGLVALAALKAMR